MNPLSFFSKTPSLTPTLEELTKILVPEKLPAHVRTLERATEYCSALQQLYETGPPHDSATHQVLGVAYRCAQNLMRRLQYSERIQMATAATASDAVAAEKHLSGLEKAAATAEKECSGAQQAVQDIDRRLEVQRAARASLMAAAEAAVVEAEQGLHAAVQNGDDVEEQSSAAKVRLARERRQDAANPEMMMLDARIDAMVQVLNERRSVALAAQGRLDLARREKYAAEIELAGVALDRATCTHSLELLAIFRLTQGAESKGSTDLVAPLGGTVACVTWVFDRRRVWFAAPDPQRRPAMVQVGVALWQLASMLAVDFDVSPLAEDLRKANRTAPATA